MSDISVNRRDALTAIGTCFGLLTVPGCETAESGKAQRVSELHNYSSVSVSRERPVEELNLWLDANRDKRVISFTGVLAYRDDCSSFMIQHEPGSSVGQRFLLLPDGEHHFQNVPKSPSALQGWRDRHPDERVIALTSIPQYSGGVKAWILCIEEASTDDNN